MLREIVVSQPTREPHRRWFSNEDFDLVVWFDDRGDMTGFELCYDRTRVERALTWTAAGGYRHFHVDAGEATPLNNETPILRPDDDGAKGQLIVRFRDAASAIEPAIRSFVVRHLREYGEHPLQELG